MGWVKLLLRPDEGDDRADRDAREAVYGEYRADKWRRRRS